MRRNVNFNNGIAEIVRKSKREEREMMWEEREREREREREWVSDFGNGTIVEIHISSHFPK